MIERGEIQSNISQDYGLSESAYSYGYDLRLKCSSFMQDSLDWVSNNCEELMPVEAPHILSLGCGSGIFDRELIKIVQKNKKHWSLTGLDFSMKDLALFRKSLLNLNAKTQDNVVLEYKKFEESTVLNDQYDLITMIHFLHSFENTLPIIQNALRHLNPGGKLLIVQQQKQGVSELKDQFIDLLPNQKFQSSDQIKSLLVSENVAFTSTTIKPSFDISMMQKNSLDSLLLMSFCFCNDLSVLPPEQQNQIRKSFLLLGKESQNNPHIIEEVMDVIVCHG